MARLMFVGIILFLSGCSLYNNAECRRLQSQGLVQGTLYSCMQCVEQFGSANPDAVNGCALGLDASNLMK